MELSDFTYSTDAFAARMWEVCIDVPQGNYGGYATCRHVMAQGGAPSAALERETRISAQRILCTTAGPSSIAHLVVRRHDDGDCVQGLGASAQHLSNRVTVSAEMHDLNLYAT